jgi:hypothetical protein
MFDVFASAGGWLKKTSGRMQLEFATAIGLMVAATAATHTWFQALAAG